MTEDSSGKEGRPRDRRTGETWVRAETLFDGRILSLRAGEVRLEDGTVVSREVVVHPGGVGILPVLGDAVVLVRQHRIAVEREVLEIPAGKRDGDETPETCGRRELEEETGYRAGRMVHAGSFYASPGYTSEVYDLFLAFDLERVGQNLEHDERIETVEISLEEAARRVAQNELKDAKTALALRLLFDYLRGDGGN